MDLNHAQERKGKTKNKLKRHSSLYIHQLHTYKRPISLKINLSHSLIKLNQAK